MITVNEALDHLFALAAPLGTEEVPLAQANGRVLRADARAQRDQPPFDASAMDGYAVQTAEVAPGARFTVIGESAAGHGFSGTLGPGQAVRIFTGAPVPAGADRVIIQEDVSRSGDVITLNDDIDRGFHIRSKGNDFAKDSRMSAPRHLRPTDIALLAAMNVPSVSVARRPSVAILSTGDELVIPGAEPGPDQIPASNSFGLHAMLRDLGAAPRLLPIARDTSASLEMAFSLAADADLVVTIGGASVGDHDLVGKVAADLGMARSFYKVAMRPGKPLMAGRLSGGAMMIGLPGNPVSAMVCGHVFLAPVVEAMLGMPATAAPRFTAPLDADIPVNGPREHYMRGMLKDGKVSIFPSQDSALLSVLSEADVLVVRPAGDGPRQAGSLVDCIKI